MPLTSTALDKLHRKIHAKAHEITDHSGLSIRISTKGTITFQVRYTLQGKPHRLSIGRYPLLTLEAARAKNLEIKKLLRENKNPCLEAKAEKSKAIFDTINVVETLFYKWQDYRKDKIKPRYYKNMKSQMESQVIAHVGKIPVKDMTRDRWTQLFIEKSKKHPVAAENLFNQVKMMLADAEFLGWIA